MRNIKGEYMAGGIVGGSYGIFTKEEMQSPEFIAPLSEIRKFIGQSVKEKKNNEQDNYNINGGNVAHDFSGTADRGCWKEDTGNRNATAKQ